VGSAQILLLQSDSVLRGLLEDLCTDDGLDVKGCRTPPDVCAAITGLPGQVVVLDATHVGTFLAEEARCRVGRPSVLPPLVILGSSGSRGVAIEGRDVFELPMPFDVDAFLSVLRAAGGYPVGIHGSHAPRAGAA
jgi:DNA-binding NtrC family response regulator